MFFEEDPYIKLPLRLYVFLEIISLSPILIMIICLGILNKPILTMIFFQMITLTFLPCYFIDIILPGIENYNYLETKFETFIPKIFKRLRGQLFKSFALTLLIFIIVACFYVIMFRLRPDLFLSIKIPLELSVLNYISVSLLLGVTNPWLEEWFWRIFLPRFYPNTEFWRLFTTFHYAIYHFFVIYFLTNNWILSILGFGGIFVMGRFFLYLRMKSGFLVSGVTHMASDICVVVIAFINLNYQIKQ